MSKPLSAFLSSCAHRLRRDSAGGNQRFPKQRWLWFVAIWAASVAALALLGWVLRELMFGLLT